MLEKNTQPQDLSLHIPPLPPQTRNNFLHHHQFLWARSKLHKVVSLITYLMTSSEIIFSISCCGASKRTSKVRTPPPLNSTTGPPLGSECILYTSAESCIKKKYFYVLQCITLKAKCLTCDFFFLSSFNKQVTEEWSTCEIPNNVGLVVASFLKCYEYHKSLPNKKPGKCPNESRFWMTLVKT